MKAKVLMFINYFGKPSETFISDEIKFLRNQSEIDLDILHYGKNISEENVYGLNLPSSFLKRIQSNPSKFSIENLKALKYRNGLNGTLGHLINFFNNKEYDTIYCHFGANGKLIAQLKSLGVISKKTKIVVRFHGMDMNFSRYPVGFYDILNEYANYVLFGSKQANDNLMKYGIDENLLFFNPVGVKNDYIISKDILTCHKPIEFQIMTVGRLVDMKGYFDSLEIIDQLRKHTNLKFKYTIVGDGPLLNELMDIIRSKNLDNYINITKFLPHEEVLQLLRQAHVYLYSGIVNKGGRSETQGLANIEAMAAGLPIVASNIGGMKDYVINKETGFLCAASDIQDFAIKIRWIMENYDSNELLTIRRNAIKMVRENYCQEDLNRKLLNLLMDV